MAKVISEFSVGNYMMLKLDDAIPSKEYTKYLIDGKEYAIVPVYDAVNCIAVESSDSFMGKTVIFE